MKAILYDGPDQVRVVEVERLEFPEENVIYEGVTYRPFTGVAWNVREAWQHDHFLFINDQLPKEEDSAIRAGEP